MSIQLSFSPVSGTGWRRHYANALAALDVAAAWMIVGLMAVMVVVVSAQVFMRYALNSSIGWADEVSRLMFVWSIFLAIPLGIKLGVHIGIEMFTARLPAGVQDALARAVALVSAALMALVCYEAIVISWDQWDEQMASVNASAALFILALAVGCGHSALHLLWIVLSGKPQVDAEVARELE
jgi:TRAP-type C4-dicarboxylate transport system permease small subunit